MNRPKFLDHIVVIVKNIRETENFYSVFLGRPDHVNEDPVSYKVGHTKIFFGLPYKEYSPGDKDAGGLNHFAFGVRDLDELRIFEKRLNNVKIQHSGIQIDKYSSKEFIWLDDPDGYRIEFYLRPPESGKNFIGWMALKEKLNRNNRNTPLFHEGEIWWCSLGENIGVEMNGKSSDFTRPVLVFKKLSKDGFLGLPMTTQEKQGSWYVKVKQGGNNVIVNLSQARVFSTKRLHKKLGELDDTDCLAVAGAFVELYLVSNKKFPPPKGGVVGKSQI